MRPFLSILKRFKKSLGDQPTLDILQTPAVQALASLCFVFGNVLVLTSMYALGFTGTYLGKVTPLAQIVQKV